MSTEAINQAKERAADIQTRIQNRERARRHLNAGRDVPKGSDWLRVGDWVNVP